MAEVRPLRPYAGDAMQEDPTMVEDLFPADTIPADDTEDVDEQDVEETAELAEQDQSIEYDAQDALAEEHTSGMAVEVTTAPVPDRVLVGEVVRWRQATQPRRVF